MKCNFRYSSMVGSAYRNNYTDTECSYIYIQNCPFLPRDAIQSTILVWPVKIRYDMREEFNVDSKAECDQLNLADVAGKKYTEKKKLKPTVYRQALYITYTHTTVLRLCGICRGQPG